jgi:[FeFe] hydrogenase H-cluster maturation GTPase HydF
MSMNSTPSGERLHIGIFGRTNAGKSSLINAITGQSLAIVSDIKGTTTDPVFKAMELLPIGPVVIIDTPGLDDTGELGLLRIQKAYQVLNKTDIALLVINSVEGISPEDEAVLNRIKEKEIPFIVVMNKADLLSSEQISNTQDYIYVSAQTGLNISFLKEAIATKSVKENSKRRICGDLLSPSDIVVLVVPIDKAAPKGRLILPQQQTIRDILEANATAVVCKEGELKDTLLSLKKEPRLVITDSQAFEQVSADTPNEIPLTSFSILFSRYKGNLKSAVKGVTQLDKLQEGDTVLICEGCTHHRQCDDIGTVKLPRWIGEYTGKKLNFAFTSGTEFPFNFDVYKLIIHCGGCMLNEREMKHRIRTAEDHNVPITNYGIAIAYMKGILKRSISAFPDIAAELKI